MTTEDIDTDLTQLKMLGYDLVFLGDNRVAVVRTGSSSRNSAGTIIQRWIDRVLVWQVTRFGLGTPGDLGSYLKFDEAVLVMYSSLRDNPT